MTTLTLQHALQATGRAPFRLDVTLPLPESGCSVIFGPSGSGKSTLLRAIAGLLRPDRAHIEIAGERWQDQQQFLPTWRRRVGFVFQRGNLFEHLNVDGNLRFAEQRCPASARRLSRDILIERLGIGALLKSPVSALSVGEQQRVAIARSLLAAPRLLLMDEPLSALDQDSRRDLLGYLSQLAGQIELPLIFVTHSMDEMTALADRIALIEDGRIVAEGTAQAMLTDPNHRLSARDDACSIIDAEVVDHHPQWQLTTVRLGAARIAVPSAIAPTQQRIRVRIDARDVSIGLEPADAGSIVNQLPTAIEAIDATSDRALVTLWLRSGDTPLLAQVTHQSLHAMRLAAGQTVTARVKATAIRQYARSGLSR